MVLIESNSARAQMNYSTSYLTSLTYPKLSLCPIGLP